MPVFQEQTQELGQQVPIQGQQIQAPQDGGTTTIAALVASDAALPNQAGLSDDDLRTLTYAMRSAAAALQPGLGMNWAAACAYVWPPATTPAKLTPSAATLANYQALVTARAALATPYYPGTT